LDLTKALQRFLFPDEGTVERFKIQLEVYGAEARVVGKLKDILK
jgi:hypothetical protein